MNMSVCAGAVLQCTFGVAPSMLAVLPANMVNDLTPAANMNDHIPLMNILPFGMCQSMSNPMVAAATAAALGVLTPMPCIPATSAPWTNASQKVMIKGSPAITNASKLTCMWGGQISVNFPGQMTVLMD